MKWRAVSGIAVAGLILAGGAIAVGQAPTTIALGQTISGALDETEQIDETGARYDDVFLPLEAGQRIEVVYMQEGEAPARLLFGAGSARTFEARAIDDEQIDGALRRVRVTAPSSGRYTLRILGAGQEAASETYRLSARAFASVEATAQVINVSESIEARLANGGARTNDQGLLFAAFRFDAKAGERFAIRASAADLDVSTILDGAVVSGAAAGFEAAEDGPFDFRVVDMDPFSNGGVISVTVETLAAPGPPPRARALRPGRAITSRLDAASATGSDFRPYEYFAVRGRPGETIIVGLASDAFDPMLEAGALTPTGFAVAQSNDDDPDGGTNAKLALRFERPGVMLVRASALSPSAAGDYVISVAPAGASSEARD